MLKLLIILATSLLLGCNTSDNNIPETDNTSTINPTIANRYFEEVFSEITINTYTYGRNTTQGGNSIDLKLDVYQPVGDPLSERPLIIYIHGGGFTINNRTTIKSLGFLQRLAKSGFVVASIDYRLIDTTVSSANTMPIAILNASEDARAAIRFFRKDHQEDNRFKINTDQIILGGYSAGAVTTLFTTFLNSQQKVNTFFTPFTTYVENNGGIEGQSGNEGFDSSVKGIFNVAGGISNVALLDNSVDFIYSLHGTRDTTVAIGDTPQLKGSEIVHQKALELNINSILNAPGLEHDILYTCDECRLALQQFLATQVSL